LIQLAYFLLEKEAQFAGRISIRNKSDGRRITALAGGFGDFGHLFFKVAYTLPVKGRNNIDA